MLEKEFDALKTYEWGVDPKVLQPIRDAIVSSHEDAAARKDLEARLIAALGSEMPRAAKDAVCRTLHTIGTAASVPALSALLLDEELTHMARYAMEDNTAPEAGKALLAALPKANGKTKIGIISSLGVRREAAAVEPLQGLLVSSDPAIAHAAARGLGAIGSLAAAKALVTAKPSAVTKAAVADASLECAENLLASGNKAAAKATYEKLLASQPSKPVLKAATSGLQACTAA
jgi:HEAT repeat protein